MIKKIMSIAILVLWAAHLSGCAAGWFLGGAATGAVVEHHVDEKNK